MNMKPFLSLGITIYFRTKGEIPFEMVRVVSSYGSPECLETTETLPSNPQLIK